MHISILFNHFLEHFFNADIDMEQACFTLNRADIDGSLIGLKKSNSGLLNNEAFISNSSLRFLPKNQRKISAFFKEFTEARNQFILSASPAKLLFQRDDGRDIFYHAFNRTEFEAWTSKSPVAVIFLEEGNEIGFESYMSSLGEYEAVAIVQGRQQKYRFCVRSRKTQFKQSTEDCCQLHLQNLNTFITNLKKSGKKGLVFYLTLTLSSLQCPLDAYPLPSPLQDGPAATTLCPGKCHDSLQKRRQGLPSGSKEQG